MPLPSLILTTTVTFGERNKALSLLTKQVELNLMEELSGTHLHMTFFAKESNHPKQCTLAYGDRDSSTPFMASSKLLKESGKPEAMTYLISPL